VDTRAYGGKRRPKIEGDTGRVSLTDGLEINNTSPPPHTHTQKEDDGKKYAEK